MIAEYVKDAKEKEEAKQAFMRSVDENMRRGKGSQQENDAETELIERRNRRREYWKEKAEHIYYFIRN